MTVAEVLDRAADLLGEHGWTPAPWGQDGQRRNVAVAVHQVVPRWDFPFVFVASALGRHHDEAAWAWQSVVDWSEEPGRTQAEVVAALRAGADLARRSPRARGVEVRG